MALEAHKQLRLQQHTPILQISYITRYVFSIHWYIDFAETYIPCYFHYYITNHNYVQNILHMPTLLLYMN